MPTKEYGNISVVFVNGVGYSSLSFKSIKTEIFDVMMTYNLTKSGWSYSIYTTKDNINCSLIANEFGGGGHAQASGFMLPSTTHPLSIFTDITTLRKKDYVL
jgi:nanoRNase/pAp phosphatase (c-di-AMP/oligoRNAs hydrolase)